MEVATVVMAAIGFAAVVAIIVITISEVAGYVLDQVMNHKGD